MSSDSPIIDAQNLLDQILKKATSKGKEKSYEDAPIDVVRLVERLINTLPEFDHAKAAKLKILFRLGDWTKMGECSKTSGKWRHLTDYDFVIVFHKETWDILEPLQKEALAHHEIMHIGYSDEKWCIIKHDVEEFHVTVKRYGAWCGSLQLMQDIIREKAVENADAGSGAVG